MLSWIATRLHQDTGRSGISWLGKGELTALKRPASGHCLFPEFSKIQKEQWPTMRGFQPSPSRLQSCLLNVLLCHSATFQSALKSRCLCPLTGYYLDYNLFQTWTASVHMVAAVVQYPLGVDNSTTLLQDSPHCTVQWVCTSPFALDTIWLSCLSSCTFKGHWGQGDNHRVWQR